MTFKAYVVGRLKRNTGTGKLELVGLRITSSPASGLTCMDGTYWCDFGTGYEGDSFAEAYESAKPHAESLEKWLRLACD